MCKGVRGTQRWEALLSTCVLFAGTSTVEAAADLSGSWVQKMHEDRIERSAGPDIGDYTGLPINEVARLRAETWDAAKWSVPEHQCEPHPADYAPHGPAALRIWSDVDPTTQQVVSWHIVYQWMNSHRVIWMDGRPAPPDNAPHTWMGFSTGTWEGDTLVVRTTHLKEGWLRRNGVPRSDRGTLTEYWLRLSNYLTVVSHVEDPVYLTEPLIRSWNWVLDPGFQITPYTCMPRVETELPRGFVAHHLPGTNELLKNFPAAPGPSRELTDGGARTMYPGYQIANAKARNANSQQKQGAKNALPARGDRERQHPESTVILRVLPIRRNVLLLSVGDNNSVVQTGADGALVVDTLSANASKQLVTNITKLTEKAIRYIINTSADLDHTGGNEALAKAGKSFNTFSGLAARSQAPTEAPIYAHEQVLSTMSAPAGNSTHSRSGAWPTETYFTASMEVFTNGEAVQLLHAPSAYSNGDSIVYFQASNVIATGNLFSTVSYPVIDLARGGTINGVIEGLNYIIDIAIPERNQEGGTVVVPGHGRVCDEYDVVIYRDMVTIIRDRVKAMKDKGMTLEQVQASGVSIDYDGRYGSEQGTWSTTKFVETVYRTLDVGQPAS